MTSRPAPLSHAPERASAELNPMVERLTAEGLSPLAAVVQRLGLEMGPTFLVQRCLRPDARGVFLEAVKVGAQWFTSEPALLRFLADCAHAHDRRGAAGEVTA